MPRTRSTNNACECIRAQASSNLLNVFMMPRLQRCAQLLREEIANQRNAPMPQRDALIEQRERGMGIALLARALGETRGG
ncbi:hypothetical protein R69888_01564 [Paraburkholderia haematera]|uniref:Uncharacterized protein n=1 Tax=Paraburkholderia haematera TaxID=2793077 RepID=A0ABN7L3M3_9BURK|nr:hypothetical protein R69888_01564 [Paraburkholderia haematera]